MGDVNPFNLPFEEAIEWFASRGYEISAEGWMDVWQAANARAFTVARVTAMDVLVDIRGEVQLALETGMSLQEFKNNLIPTLKRKGWFGEARITPWRLENIYRTNLQTAFSVGRYSQQMEVAGDRPYWQYKATLDANVRPEHAAMHNKIYHYTHPFWDVWYPLNGFL